MPDLKTAYYKLISHGLLRHAALSALLCISLSSPALAIFEGYSLYGASPYSFSLGGSAVPSRFDTLSFLRNPASITDVNHKSYIFANGSLGGGSTSKYNYTVFSMTQPRRSAMTLIRSNELDVSRDMFVYTYGFGSEQDKMYYGVSLAPFRFKKTYRIFTGEVKSGDGTGFSLDAGIIYYMGPKIKIGASLSNFISNISSEKDTSMSGNLNLLPQTMSLGFEYLLKENINLNLSLSRFKYNKDDYRVFNSMSLGVEYILPSRGSVRVTGQKIGNAEGYGESDKFIAAGGSYRTESYDATFSTLNKNDTFSSARAFALTWKTAGEWLPPARATEPKFATKTHTATTTTTVKYEPPLPKSEPIRPISNFDTDLFPIDDSPAPDDSKIQIIKKSRPIYVSATSVSPSIIIVPFGSSQQFFDVGGHWSSSYVSPLNSLGFYPFASGTFSPDRLISNSEFHRQVLLLQLTRTFAAPVTVLFTAPEPVSAAATLNSPSLDSSILLLKGSYEKSGAKRILIDRALLSERAVSAGRYKLNVHLTADNDGEADFGGQITVLDTSIDFSTADGLTATEREKKLDEIRGRLGALGLSSSYLDSVGTTENVTRIDALMSLLTALNVSVPSGREHSLSYSDTGSLSPTQKNAVYLSSLPLASLGYKSLMSGYPDGTFRPGKAITNGESAALISRAVALDTIDFGATASPRSAISTSGVAPAPVPPVKLTQSSATAQPAPVRTPAPSPAPRIASSTQPGGTLIKIITPGGGSSVWSPVSSSQPAPAPVTTPSRSSINDSPQRAYGAPQDPASNVRYLVVAKKYLREENARASVDDLERMGLSATTFTESAPGGPVFYVILGAFQSRIDAESLASTQITDYNLEVKRIELNNETVKALPLSTRKQPPARNLNEREVIMTAPSDDSSNIAPQRKFKIQQ